MTVQPIPPLNEMTSAQLDELFEAVQETRFIRGVHEEPPAWHGDVLRQREEALENGTDRFISLEEVESRFRERTR